ncbi:hypothetical protein BT93_E0295 [Corymbia citriodora subsp. variegata]|nr:hypothetical protein BT93_E0295 [Corymbia citriodora subsp. variegata]
MGRAPHERSVFLLLVAAISIACASAFGPKTQELIDTICCRMEDYGFCYKCFSEHISTPETDMPGLARIAVEQSLHNGSATLNLAKRTLRNTTDPELENYLRICINGYLKILDLIENADRVFRNKNYCAVLTDFLNSAKVLAIQCGRYSNRHGIRNPLYENNREERILITMGAATAYSLLLGGSA